MRLQAVKSASFRPRTQWMLPARLLSVHFLSESMPLNSRSAKRVWTGPWPSLPRQPPVPGFSREHTPCQHTCAHRGTCTHSHIHIVHIFLRVTVDLTHIIVTQSVPTTGLSLASFPPKLLESSNPQGLPPQTHSECAHPGPALDARSLYPNLRRSPSATCKPIELAPWEG